MIVNNEHLWLILGNTYSEALRPPREAAAGRHQGYRRFRVQPCLLLPDHILI